MDSADGWMHRFVHDARELGVREGDLLLVHSSMRSLASVPGGTDTVLDALRAAVGGSGTLLFPALSYEIVTRRNPSFNVATTGTNVGILAEHFRLRRAERRSVHPTHSVCAAGPATNALLAEHHLDRTPCGPHSPFSLLAKAGGRILMLGCGLKPNTSMHAVEELAEPPYLYGPQIEFTITDESGMTRTVRYRTHGFSGYTQRYDRVREVLGEPNLRHGLLVGANSWLIDAAELRRAAYERLVAEPLSFVDAFG